MPRPVFLNLTQIQFPVGAVTSIGHRVSGVLLALAVPAGLFLLDLSLQDEAGFRTATALFEPLLGKLIVAVLLWALLHHLLAGVRHLLTDFNVGSRLGAGRRSAWMVNLAAPALALLAAMVVL